MVQRKKYRKAEYVQRRVRFVNVQSSLHENVVFSVCARMCNAAYVISIMWNSKKISGNFLRGGEGGMLLRDGPIFEVVFNF